MASMPFVKGAVVGPGGTIMGPFQRKDPSSQSHGSVADAVTADGAYRSHSPSKSKGHGLGTSPSNRPVIIPQIMLPKRPSSGPTVSSTTYEKHTIRAQFSETNILKPGRCLPPAGDATQPDDEIDPLPERNPASQLDILGIMMGPGGIPMPRNSATRLLIEAAAKADELPPVKTELPRRQLPVFHVIRKQELDQIVRNASEYTRRVHKEHLHESMNEYRRVRLEIAKQFCLHDKAFEKSANDFQEKWKELSAMASGIRKRRELMEKMVATRGMQEEADAKSEAARPTSQGEFAGAVTPSAHSVITQTDASTGAAAEGDGDYDEEGRTSSDEVAVDEDLVTHVGSCSVLDLDTLEDQSLSPLHTDESMQTLVASTMKTYESAPFGGSYRSKASKNSRGSRGPMGH